MSHKATIVQQQQGDSHLKHNSLISTIPWLPFLTLTQCRLSLTYLFWPPLGVLALHSISTQTCPLPISAPSNWLRLFSIQFPIRIPQQSHPGYSSYLHRLWRWNRQSVPKRRHIKFRRWGINQKKEYNIQNMAKVWNQERNNKSHKFSCCIASIREFSRAKYWSLLCWFLICSCCIPTSTSSSDTTGKHGAGLLSQSLRAASRHSSGI
jgi:hypothetical protein